MQKLPGFAGWKTNKFSDKFSANPVILPFWVGKYLEFFSNRFFSNDFC
jgi:hypothetical protein